ncbi:Mth938-like domain-containing protein [Marinicella gelatinilytica]|uniref:Mth938-like domain-containing protein n=1 Tax=Marinicella gelatinilytica TaxID=2996017 RepID=UPI002260E8C6|nr:MTH938/NDUFAF3 family protein [Marinicella gelatinilytica]MCX7544352.1 MTH938/NDUFAF3 family protein [Marinicella gelatinilytica]
MDLSETVTQHPNIIKSAAADFCEFYHQTYRQSILIPWDEAIETVAIKGDELIDKRLVKKMVNMNPEVILLATGESIQFPDSELLTPLIKNNIGFEVLDNQAAARTFNILLSEEREVICLMIIND